MKNDLIEFCFQFHYCKPNKIKVGGDHYKEIKEVFYAGWNSCEYVIDIEKTVKFNKKKKKKLK